MSLEDAIQLIAQGECLLFVGADFCSLAINADGNPLPMGPVLADILDKESKFNSKGNLPLASEYYRDKVGDVNLISLLNRHLTPVTIHDDQVAIAGHHWRRVYTTNYDDCFELAGRKNGMIRRGVDEWTSPNECRRKNDIVIHLNGILSTMTATSLDSEFKLTNGSHLANGLIDNPWREIFKNDLADCKVAFFVGFSMDTDLDLTKILFNSQNLRDKSFFIVNEDEEESEIYSLSKFGNVECIGIGNFAKRLRNISVNNELPTDRIVSFTSFILSLSIEASDRITDADRRNLFIWGKYNEGMLGRALTLHDFGNYFIYRTKLETAVNVIHNGIRNIAVHGDIGNGKSMFVHALKLILISEGYHVYVLKEENDNTYRELEYITSRPDIKTALILEQYHLRKHLLEQFKGLRTDTLLITTERTVYHDMNIDWLETHVTGTVHEVNLNRLDNDEIDRVVSIFTCNGFWSDMAAFREEKKKGYIIDECRRSLREVLLGLLRTASIQKSIAATISSLNRNTVYRDCLILMLISSYLSLGLDMDMISFALNKTLDADKIRRDPVIKEFVDLSDGSITVKSSLTAEVLLGEIMDIEAVKKVLVKAFRQFDYMRHEKKYKDILSNLLTFRTLRQPLNAEAEKFHIVIGEFYEEIKDCSFCEGNPHFWLQYAIAVMDELDYKSAKIYFDSAYAFARKKRDVDVYQIDNHYARYLLEHGSSYDVGKEYMQVFRKAHSIVTDKSHSKEQKYYPFRVARGYLEYYLQYKNKFTKDETREMEEACSTILRMIQDFRKNSPDHANRRDVRECEKNIYRILNEINNGPAEMLTKITKTPHNPYHH